MKLLFLNNFLMHDISHHWTYHKWFSNLISIIVKPLINFDVLHLYDIEINGEKFSREKFYNLSGIKNPLNSYYLCDIENIKQESWEYLFKYIDNDTFVFGFELSLELREVLDKKGINFVNFWVHSFKLFDDVPFMINTNNKEIFLKLQNYKIPKIKFEFYANYWKQRLVENSIISENSPLDDSIEENSLLFVGQTFKDISIKKGDKYLNILDFKEKLEEYSKKYNKIYYLPHPHVLNIQEVDEYIESKEYLEKLENIPTYYLLASDKIKKVVGISSSVLYEAQFFNKEIEYLYQPLFDIDGEFGLNSFTSILNNYFNPKFWADILSGFFEIKSEVLDEVLFNETQNKVRDIKNLYWGYQKLDNIKKLQDENARLNHELHALIEQTQEQIKNNRKKYEEIFSYILQKDMIFKRYKRYKFLSLISFGSKKKYYEEKKAIYEKYIEKINYFARIKL